MKLGNNAALDGAEAVDHALNQMERDWIIQQIVQEAYFEQTRTYEFAWNDGEQEELGCYDALAGY